MKIALIISAILIAGCTNAETYETENCWESIEQAMQRYGEPETLDYYEFADYQSYTAVWTSIQHKASYLQGSGIAGCQISDFDYE